MESILAELRLGPIVATLVYSIIGIIIFLAAFGLMNKLTPFSIRKEIEEDQNIALGVIIGSVLIGLAMIIAAAVQG